MMTMFRPDVTNMTLRAVFFAIAFGLILPTSSSSVTERSNTSKIIQLKTSLYLESKCPDCHQFFHKQFAPVYQKFPEYITLDLIPFGNAHMIKLDNGSYVITCQHGPDECLGNMYEACATKLMQETSPGLLVKYYDCLAQLSDMKEGVRKCANTTGVNFEQLDNCTKTKGTDYIVEYGKRTEALKGRKFVPTVVIDDEFNIKDQKRIAKNFFKYFCEKIKGDQPEQCNEIQNVPKKV